MVVKSTATIAVTSESWDTDSPAGIVMVFSVPASEPDEVDAADAVDVLLLVSEEPVDPHAVSASAVAAATRARITCLFLQVLLFSLFFLFTDNRTMI